MALVLIVDDEPAELRMLTRVVERSGHRVVTAQDGLAGLNAFLTHRPDWVITDLAMPGKDGVAMIAEIRAGFPEARIIAATGQTSERSLEAAIQAGAVATLRKPFEITQVTELLAHLERPGPDERG